jgi:hypothetical protein
MVCPGCRFRLLEFTFCVQGPFAFAWWKQIRTARLATGGEELDIPAEVICERLISGVLDLEQHAGGGLLGGRRPT